MSQPEETPAKKPKGKQGFASMDPAKQRAIASMGGKAAHAKGVGYKWTEEEAREAGRKGGIAAHAKGTAYRFHPRMTAKETLENAAAPLVGSDPSDAVPPAIPAMPDVGSGSIPPVPEGG